MANHASAAKADRQSKKHRIRNRNAMSTLRTAVKAARTAIDDKATDAVNATKTAIAIIDKAVTKGLLKRNTASRYVSRLSVRGRE